VTAIELGSTGRTRIFHVHDKPLYAAIGEPDNRNRRRVTIDRAIERLMILDGVLADPSVTWLGSEREKRRYFKQRLGDHLRDDEYPRLVFGERPNVTVRYFPDKLPVGYDSDHRRHVFIYLARSPSPMDFRMFILRHLELLNALGFWTIRVLLPRALAGSMNAYRNAAHELLSKPLSLSQTEDLTWCLRQRGLRALTPPARSSADGNCVTAIPCVSSRSQATPVSGNRSRMRSIGSEGKDVRDGSAARRKHPRPSAPTALRARSRAANQPADPLALAAD